jgi:phage terminase large subunit-like protein
LAIDANDTVHVVWQDATPGNAEIYYRRSMDGGSTWSAVKRLTWTSGESYEPAIAIDSNGHIHIIWYDSTPDHFEIYSKKSSDGGSTWSAAKRITWTSGGAMEAVIALDLSNALHVLWYGYPSGNAEISYKKSVDGGAYWSAARRLTWTSGGSFRPAIAIDPSNVIHVIWYDDTPGNTEIYYKRSTDGGTAWSAVKRLTWTSGDSACPAIDANDTIHIVWYDDTPGNTEIYYKKGK